MEKLQSLLHKISIAVKEEETILQEKRMRGDLFNMFGVCGVNHYEVTHSSIIAEFLNPQGSHGQENLFLAAFVECLKFKDFDFLLENVSVETEMVIPDGRIDIVITNNNQQALIIENKIYAQDQLAQLRRYDNYAKSKYRNGYKILYLTLDGRQTTDEKSQEVDYLTISYRYHIVDWLNRCKYIAIDKPVIRETLNQYIRHIKNLTNITEMNTQQRNEMFEILIKNHKETAKILNLHKDLEEHIVKKILFQALGEVAQEFDMHFELGDNNKFFSKSKGAYFAIKPNQKKTWHIGFEFESGNWRGLDVGLVWDEDQRKNRKSLGLLSPLFTKGPNDVWFYGWKYVDNKDWNIEYILETAYNIEGFKNSYAKLLEDILSQINNNDLL